MSIDEIEATILKLRPKDRARLAERLLESLEDLSREENEKLWSEEASGIGIWTQIPPQVVQLQKFFTTQGLSSI